MRPYTLSSTTPKISPGTGSGGGCSALQTSGYLVCKRTLEMAMDTHGLDVTLGVDAVSHMRHYMNNTGRDYLLNMPELMVKSAQLKLQFDEELAQAKAVSQTEDRYNWDDGKSVTLAGIEITGEFMQKFHQQCYVPEFDFPTLKRAVHVRG